MISPVKSESTIVKASTGSESCAPWPGSSGRKFAAIFGTSGTNRHARSAPNKPAKMLTSMLSKTKSRSTLARDAPRAMRNAISRRRPLKRTSKRLATLLQAIRSTKLTAASKVANAGRRSPLTSSGKVFSVVVKLASIFSGNWV